MQNLLDDLKEVLSAEPKYLVDGDLLKNKIVEDALKLEPALLKILLKSSKTKQHFFTDVDSVAVFDKVKFQEFVSNKAFLPDSFTTFKNKIGLTSNGSFLKQSNDVVLSWAYKDCVLEGGMTKEDAKVNVAEVFYNETLAPDEINRLLDEKVFTNFEFWDEEAVKANKSKKPKEITTDDNLLIKGNNLLALHCLKRKYAGKIKLIYIDPPYNTGNDGFKYNDSFNHSTWLTFMKNRLEVAKELLSEDGSIFVQIDSSPSNLHESPELGYILVLLDDIFGRKNYISNLIWKKKGNASNTESDIGTITENIVFYAKNFDSLSLNMQAFKRTYKFLHNGKPCNIEQPVKTNSGEYERKTMQYEVQTKEGVFLPPSGKRWTIGEAKAKDYVSEGKYKIIDGKFYVVNFPEDYKKGEAKLYNNLLLEHGSLKQAKNELKSLGFEREAFDSPKPEVLMQRVFDIATSQGDLILDFFGGSGTTPAVAHKMGRKWIAVEQMDYIKGLPEERLKKVVGGEQGGISKSINWQGGGSFVYMEIAEWNEEYIQKIRNAENAKQLLAIYEEMRNTREHFFKYDFEHLKFDRAAFETLSLEEQKKVLCAILNKNHLYKNYSEIEDADYAISDEDKKLTKSFYGDK